MAVLGPNGQPLAGPEVAKAVIGGLELDYFANNNDGLQFGAVNPLTGKYEISVQLIGQQLTTSNMYINALCREVVSLREELQELRQQLARVADYQSSADTVVKGEPA